MRRLRPPFLSAALVLLVAAPLTACAAVVDPPAVTIARDASSPPYYTLSSDELWAEVNESRGPGGTQAATDAGSVTQVLNSKVRSALLRQVLAEKNLTPTAADKDAAMQQLRQTAQGEPDQADIDVQAGISALSRVLAEDFFSKPGNEIEPYARRFYDQQKAQFETPAETCLHVVLVSHGSRQPTDADFEKVLPQAQEYRRRLDSEPFEKVADESQAGSDQPIPGGDLKCVPDEQLPQDVLPAIAAVPVGTVSQPLKWSGGWVITRVDDRKPKRLPPFEEIRAQVVDRTQRQFGQQFVSELLTRTSKSAVVTIDPRYGRWDAEQVQVLAPEGAANPTVPTTVAPVDPLIDEHDAPSAPPGTTPSP